MELEDYLDLIGFPDPFSSLSKQDHKDLNLYCAIVLEHLLWVCNEICFKEVGVSFEESIQLMRNRFRKFKNALRKNDSVRDMLSNANDIREWI